MTYTRSQRFRARLFIVQFLILLLCGIGLNIGTINASALNSFTAEDIWVYSRNSLYVADIPSATGSGWKDPTGTTKIVELPSWDTLTAIANAVAVKPTMDSAYPAQQKIKNIVSAYGSKTNYDNSTKDLKEYVVFNIDEAGLVAKNDTTSGKSKASSAISSFNSSVSSLLASNTFETIYDNADWDPSAGIAAGALSMFYDGCNTVFYVVSQLVVWWFMVQTAFDGLYLVCDPVRKYIISADKTGGSSGISSGGEKRSFCLPICSKAVAEAVLGEGRTASSGIGGGVNANGHNQFVTYMIKRSPTFIMLAIYLILVSMGYWTKLISWVAGFASQFLDFIVGS